MDVNNTAKYIRIGYKIASIERFFVETVNETNGKSTMSSRTPTNKQENKIKQPSKEWKV